MIATLIGGRLTELGIAAAVIIGLIAWYQFDRSHQLSKGISQGVTQEQTRQETLDAQIARKAHAAVRNPAARRVLDPTTITSIDGAGQ